MTEGSQNVAVQCFGVSEKKNEDGKTALVTIHEGKFHQIKRMFQHQDKTVQTLKRLSIGPLVLDERLAPGDWRPLTGEEIREILQAADMM